jgi:lipid A 3-O-deacylase
VISIFRFESFAIAELLNPHVCLHPALFYPLKNRIILKQYLCILTFKSPFMRFFALFLAHILFVLSCSNPDRGDAPFNESEPPDHSSNEQIVVDFPAAVMLQADSVLDKRMENNEADKRHAGELLRPFNIPLIDTDGEDCLFIKANGDTVVINLSRLEPRHNLILFTHHNDPLPTNYSELPLLLKKVFPEQFDTAGKKIPGNEPDDHSPVRAVENPAGNGHIPRKVVFNIASEQTDTILPQTLLPVEWIFHTLNPEKHLRITFENDLITLPNSDRYFTNGINIELQAPFLERSALNRLMIPYRNHAIVTYTLGIYQDIFTPVDTRIAPQLKTDRPYASYLMLGFRKSMANERSKFNLTSEIKLGYLGKYSPGEFLQSLTHETIPTNDPPIGWELQLNSDLIANYMIKAEKSVYSRPHLELSWSGVLNAGTMFTDAGVGVNVYAGSFSSFYQPYRTADSKPFRYSFFMHGAARVVGFNALLQGGVFGSENIAALSASQVQRLVYSGEFGLRLEYYSTAVVVAQHFLSPEYKGGLPHKWGRVSFYFGI